MRVPVGRKRTLRIAGSDLYAALYVENIEVSRELGDELGSGRYGVLPVLLQPVHIEQHEPGRRVVGRSGASTADIVRGLHPLLFGDGDFPEAEKGNGVGRARRQQRLVDLLGVVDAPRGQIQTSQNRLYGRIVRVSRQAANQEGLGLLQVADSTIETGEGNREAVVRGPRFKRLLEQSQSVLRPPSPLVKLGRDQIVEAVVRLVLRKSVRLGQGCVQTIDRRLRPDQVTL